jgi:hypothetical protein
MQIVVKVSGNNLGFPSTIKIDDKIFTAKTSS